MDIQAIKLQLIEELLQTEEVSILEKVKTIFDINRDKSKSLELREVLIERALKAETSIKEGRTYSVNEVRNRFKEKV